MSAIKIVKLYFLGLMFLGNSCASPKADFNKQYLLEDLGRINRHRSTWKRKDLKRVLEKHFQKGLYYSHLPVSPKLMVVDGTETGWLLRLIDTVIETKQLSIYCDTKDFRLSDDQIVWETEDSEVKYKLYVDGKLDSISIDKSHVYLYLQEADIDE